MIEPGVIDGLATATRDSVSAIGVEILEGGSVLLHQIADYEY